MSKVDHLVQLIRRVEAGEGFTAEQIAREFEVSLRTAQRYMLDVSCFVDVVRETALETGKRRRDRLVKA